VAIAFDFSTELLLQIKLIQGFWADSARWVGHLPYHALVVDMSGVADPKSFGDATLCLPVYEVLDVGSHQR
jgi:hypothetical protein